MALQRLLLSFLIGLLSLAGIGQTHTTSLSGIVLFDETPLSGVYIEIPAIKHQTTSNSEGRFSFPILPSGRYVIHFAHTATQPYQIEVNLKANEPAPELRISLRGDETMDQVVITGSRTFEKRSESTVNVHILRSKTLERIQATHLSEGMCFQSGLRVETDCQTCNYTQLRMNGLGGAYSQILVNGHPVISSLAGLYILEQIPANLIERVEILRGGGSALYGSNAIGGTVNVITRNPSRKHSELSMVQNRIGNGANEQILMANTSLLAPGKKSGVRLFGSIRKRNWYDHNGDQYSELPELFNRSIGLSGNFGPDTNRRSNWTLIWLNEFRVGGEMSKRSLTQRGQVEERKHHIGIGSLDYAHYWDNRSQYIMGYIGIQQTIRSHFTGILPDLATEVASYQSRPPYGNSRNFTMRSGVQYNRKLKTRSGRSNLLTSGLEYTADNVLDEIEAYAFRIDQRTSNLGAFIQSNWKISRQFSLLTGLRSDQHNMVRRPIWSPRISARYQNSSNSIFRLTAGTGFRAPQAFDADMHIAFAGGGVSRIQLDPDLVPERSGSISVSHSFDKASRNFIYGFSSELFLTRLNRAFVLEANGSDSFGLIFKRTNGLNAQVYGFHFEFRANLRRIWQLETGFTVQRNYYSEIVQVFDDLPGTRDFLRTPGNYGYGILSWMPEGKWSVTLNGVYTGSMLLAHFGGAPDQPNNELKKSPAFLDLGLRTVYAPDLKEQKFELELYAGLKNLFNAYQNDFDIGKNRDSNYVYGPALPRTIYFGLKVVPN
ncbi:MAG: TonB-dependent receptor [Flavobacteriales bacterium]|nr:TonB-dependent receptor [Flavobacteriales bacterium]